MSMRVLIDEKTNVNTICLLRIEQLKTTQSRQLWLNVIILQLLFIIYADIGIKMGNKYVL